MIRWRAGQVGSMVGRLCRLCRLAEWQATHSDERVTEALLGHWLNSSAQNRSKSAAACHADIVSFGTMDICNKITTTISVTNF